MSNHENGTLRIPQEIFFDGKQWPPNFTAEKVRSAKAMIPRPDDVFICTYPKSGTTWLQHIVHQLMGKPDYDAQKANGDEKKSMFFASPLIERFGADYTEEMESPRILKSHLTFGEIPKGGGAKYIYSCRNPKDCLTSYYHHFINFKHYYFENGDFDVYFDLFMNGKVGLGDYFDHFTSWLEAIEKGDENILALKYEDMVADLRSTIIKIASFLGGAAAELIGNEENLSRIVKASTLESMKKDQKRWFPDGMTYRRDVFVRKGGSRDWKNLFSLEQSKRMDERFRERCVGTVAEEWWKSEMRWNDNAAPSQSNDDPNKGRRNMINKSA